jgi:sirohydrochlorin cobaltochelatase
MCQPFCSGLIDLLSSHPYNLSMAEHNSKEISPPGETFSMSPVSSDLAKEGWVVLIVAHGSPEEKGNVHFRQTFSLLSKLLPPDIDLRQGFIEHASPSVSDSIRDVSPRIAGIAMVPYLLFDAGHSKSDVPSYIAEAKKRFPGLPVIREWALGTDQVLVDILLDILPPVEKDKKEALILVGRGSLDSNANASLYYQSRRLWERRRGAEPQVTFIGVTEPRLSEVISGLKADFDRLMIVPVFLFEGVLMDRIRHQANLFQSRTGFAGEILITPAFGDHPLLLAHMAKRIKRLLGLGRTPMPRWPVVRSDALETGDF